LLQRRIADAGGTFRDLLVEARRELGRQLLSNQTLQLDAVASSLGDKNVSSFFRAFREWEGMTPSEWRNRKRE
jgi:AraC-like DNA-binding protein